MKNNNLLLISFFLLTISFLSARESVDFPEEYIVRPGDVFTIQIISLQTQDILVPVTVTGHLTLYPITSPIKVAGHSLKDVQGMVTSEIRRFFPNAKINVDLYSIIPYSVHIFGAVTKPGEYVVDTLMTLYQSLQLAGDLSPAASKRIKITRNEQIKIYDLNRYFALGDLSENPLVFSDDLIRVDFANEFAKLYVVTDSVNYVEYFEMETEKQVAELLPLIKKKYSHSDYEKIFLRRDGILKQVEHNYYIRAGDNIYLHPEESFIYVRGNVARPSKFTYYPGKNPEYYISLSGGVSRTGSQRRIFIVSKDGDKTRYRGQEINEGDSIIIPLATRTWLTDYLTPISAIISMTATIIVLTR
ncbi:MAG: SLBB domain-containing protein [Candidatus Cloacimonetes bacterium]|nr:SLBB domain-containing protein [Candidatus Cloacimonadota bacterium]